MSLAILGIVALLAGVAAVFLALRLLSLQGHFTARVQQELALWRQRDLLEAHKQIQELVRREGAVEIAAWKEQYTDTLRHDAIQKSQAVTAGKVYEQLIPYLPGFRFNPKDARFIGSPVDFLVFDGLTDGEVSMVWFVEVKTGSSSLSTRERRVRDAVQAGRVEWFELRLPTSIGLSSAPGALPS